MKIGGGGTTKAPNKRWGNSVPPSSPLLWPLGVCVCVCVECRSLRLNATLQHRISRSAYWHYSIVALVPPMSTTDVWRGIT